MNQSMIAFSALSQETRLKIFRALVRAGEDGLLSGELGEQLHVKQNTMSANLAVLLTADLVINKREGRTIRYFANMAAFKGLLSYLLEDCCGGQPELCRPFVDRLATLPAHLEKEHQNG